jgi:hypothetical protein
MKRLVWCIVLLSLVSVGVLSGCAEPEPPPPVNNFKNPKDLTGTWAQLQVWASVNTSTVPILGKATVDSISKTLFLVKAKQVDNKVELTYKSCSIELDSGTIFVTTTMPDAFVKAIPVTRRDATISVKGGKYTAFKQTKWYQELRGVKLKNFLKDKLPSDPKDSRVFDQDKDGNPGMTVEVGGIFTGKLYQVQRIQSHIVAKTVTLRQIDGLLDWKSEQVNVGTDNENLLAEKTTKKNEDPTTSYFRMTRVNDDATCAQLIKSKEGLFKREGD